MFPYWILFAYFAAGTFLHRSTHQRGGRDSYPLLTLGVLLIALMVGLRYQVGGDWFGYQRIFSFAGRASLDQVMLLGDPAYQLLNWTVQQIGGELWLVNLVCGGIFAWGLLMFARVQPISWLAILVAVPYLIVVVAMGYSRQAVAIAILMAGLARLERGGSTLRFILYVVAAALFHKTAIVVLPLVILSAQRNKFLNVVLGVAVSFLLYDFFVSSSTDRLVRNYIEAEYTAQGAAIRVAMGIIPASLFLLYQRRFGFAERERRTWRNFSLAAFLFLFLLLLFPSSAAIDRLALYLMPLQIAILSRTPLTFRSRQLGILAIVTYSFFIQYVWLNYATHADDWIPYRTYLTE